MEDDKKVETNQSALTDKLNVLQITASNPNADSSVNNNNEPNDGAKKDKDELSDVDDDGEDSDESSDSSSDEEEPIKAPLELLGEFLLYIRQGEWEDAKKLCKMILIYEPENPEALQFKNLIDEKIQVEKELAELSSDGDDTSSSEEDETTDEEDVAKVNEKEEDASKKESNETESEDEEDRTEHLRNKLVFSSTDQKVWKP